MLLSQAVRVPRGRCVGWPFLRQGEPGLPSGVTSLEPSVVCPACAARRGHARRLGQLAAGGSSESSRMLTGQMTGDWNQCHPGALWWCAGACSALRTASRVSRGGPVGAHPQARVRRPSGLSPLSPGPLARSPWVRGPGPPCCPGAAGSLCPPRPSAPGQCPGRRRGKKRSSR